MHLRAITGALVWMLVPTLAIASELSIVEASIEELQDALRSGQTNAVQLVAKHLHRVAQYDRRGPRLNSIPVLNPWIFDHAQASDEYRAQSNGTIRSSLEGIPCTIKDSYMMEGLTVAAGSPAFQNLTATFDAFTTAKIREGGGLVIGKTNMPPMANGGMQRGIYGRAESPYNGTYLAAAYASGSTNGGGASTAASLAVFAMGEETVSSGRSPASNNALVAYTPSRGVISIRGNWPLSPVSDVVVPYARSVKDLLSVLDLLVEDDEDTTSDFWRGQPFVTLPTAKSVRPGKSYDCLADANALHGKRVGVPRMYIGKHDPAAQPSWISPQVVELWKEAQETLESLGAIVVEVGFPLVTNFETAPTEVAWKTDYPIPASVEGEDLDSPFALWSYGWDDFLRMVNDTNDLTKLADVDPRLIFPQLPNTLPDRYGNQFMNRTEGNIAIQQLSVSRNGSIFDTPGLEAHVKAVEARRKRDLEEWMDANSLDALVWPSVGDVGREDAETNEESAVHAWRNGVFFSHGNYAIRLFGVPTVGSTMGTLDSGIPVGLTFASKAYDDNSILSYAFAFESAHKKRPVPPRTPQLETDLISKPSAWVPRKGSKPPQLVAKAQRLCDGLIEVTGTIEALTCGGLRSLEVFVDGVSVGPVQVDRGAWSVRVRATEYDEPKGDVPVRPVNVPDQSLAMIVVVATGQNGRSDGKLIFT